MGQNIMKNKIDFQKVLVTWKAKPERNAKQLFSFGLQNTAPGLGQKKMENHMQRNYLSSSNLF